ncbi:MAG: thioredoxin family protein [Pelagimonas sp.]|uniref:thioredoxin family protein n=1 Tax=Pelagimonas sp. TaxID=2073170 RepID=UPI003D6A10FA
MFGRLLIALLSFAVLPSISAAQPFLAGFNDRELAWNALDDGLKLAQAQEKPILLLVHATWCPVCREYRNVFSINRLLR